MRGEGRDEAGRNKAQEAQRGMKEFFLADDLSGALDAGAAFFRAGRRVRTVLEGGLPEPWGDEVVAVTTETRNGAAEVAREKVRGVLERARESGARLLFKKIDSTMRGPVAAELEALLAAMPKTRVLFSPANPAAGRTVRDGVLYVRGVRVSETEFARDPVWPVRASELKVLLGEAANERVTIADAETQEDLERAVKEMRARGGDWVAVGSGALAAAVAGKRIPNTGGESVAPGRMLVVCGSGHPLNRVQAERLKRERGARTREVTLRGERNPGELNADVLTLETMRGESAAALRAIVGAAKEAIERERVRKIFVTGGETAFALCQELGVRELEFSDEVETGVCVCEAEQGGARMWIAVKPGGFGDEETWVRVWDRLRGKSGRLNLR